MSNKSKAIIKLIFLLLIVIVIPIILYLTCKDTLFNIDWLKAFPEHFSEYKLISALSLIVLQALQVIICLVPGQPIQFASSYAFGVVGGYLISIIGAIIGALIAFYLAKWLGAEGVNLLFGKDKVDNYHKKINTGKGLLIVLIIYLIPGLPKDLIGYVAGISEMRLLPFLLVSSVGRSPGMLGSLFIGHFFQAKNYLAIIIIAVICLIILFICWKNKESIISFMDEIEAKDVAREDKKHGKTTK